MDGIGRSRGVSANGAPIRRALCRSVPSRPQHPHRPRSSAAWTCETQQSVLQRYHAAGGRWVGDRNERSCNGQWRYGRRHGDRAGGGPHDRSGADLGRQPAVRRGAATRVRPRRLRERVALGPAVWEPGGRGHKVLVAHHHRHRIGGRRAGRDVRPGPVEDGIDPLSFVGVSVAAAALAAVGAVLFDRRDLFS